MLAFGLAGLTDLAMGEQVENPIRVRMNSDIITTLFKKGDQRIIDAFQDIVVSGSEEDQLPGDLSFYVDTKEGIEREDYDF